MAWRLHLTNRTIEQLDILTGTPALLAAWWKRDRVTYYDLQSGALLDEVTIELPEVDDRNSLNWQNFVRNLKAPNGVLLPFVTTPHEMIYLAEDDHLRVYRSGQAELFVQLQHGSDEIKLDVRSGTIFQQVVFDRKGDLIAGLDVKGKLHLYRQTRRLGVYDAGLHLKDDNRASLAVAQGGEKILMSDPHQIVQMDAAGKIIQRLTTHYAVGRMACSPNAAWIVTSDADTGVVRVYNGADLTLAYQRFGIDLLAEATQVQLLADLPPLFVALNALTIDDSGTLALAMSGIICVTSVDKMDNIQHQNAARTFDETTVRA